MADVLARPLHAGWEEFPIKSIIEAFNDDDWEDEEWEDEDWDEDEDEDWDEEDEEWEDEDEWEDEEDWGEGEEELSLGRKPRTSGWN